MASRLACLCVFQLAHIFPQNYIPVMVSQILFLTIYFPMNLFSAEYQKIFSALTYSTEHAWFSFISLPPHLVLVCCFLLCSPIGHYGLAFFRPWYLNCSSALNTLKNFFLTQCLRRLAPQPISGLCLEVISNRSCLWPSVSK